MPLMTDPFIGTVIADKYELLSVLGVGGMSTIYKAKHKYMGRIAAVKLLHPYLIADASMFQRFQYEAKAASNLNHPNVVGVQDFGITDDGKAYLVMDYLEGEDLSSILDRETLLPEVQALEIFRQACRGLDHAHSKGVIHRDLKPSNLFLCPEEDDTFVVKLVDFGIAKITEAPGEEAQHLTRTGEVFGSPLYMSPEQCSGKPLDARSDLYSLGCVMYEVLTGRRPLAGATAIDTMHKHLKEAPPPFKEMAPNAVVSEELEKAVLKCLAKKPADRYDSVAAFYEDVFKEPMPRSSATGSRANNPSVNLEVRTGGGTGAAKVEHSKNSPAKASASSKWRLPAGLAVAVAILSTVGLGTWVMFIWDGPATDRGHQIDRWMYTYHLTRGDNLVNQKQFTEAENELLKAQDIAAKFGDNYGRLMNVYRSELTLYTASNQFEKQSDIINKMTRVTSLRAHHDFDLSLQAVQGINDLLSNKNKGISRIGEKELELRLSALINGIRDTASRLGAVGDYDHQETLLTRTIDTYSKLVGDDDPQLAALNLDLAESHVNQDEFTEARPLFKKSLEIYCQARTNNRGTVDELDEAKAWLRIGQFDRDRSFFREADTELTTAYNLLKPYGEEKKASEKNGRGIKLLIECLNALADYSDQTAKPDLGKKYRQEAQEKKQLRKKLGLGLNE
ncbi:MAG: serine/threonine protein kinase [Cyanobacteria bacterium SZAS LIN-3]|nr:serine/threonine protein kinase [Cyanobacteria bacterium SZAS LIN-3]